MRSEDKVLGALVAWSKRSDDILAMRITRSRGDPAGVPDGLSDCDIEVFVRDRNKFAADDSWIDTFGEVMVRWPLQTSLMAGSIQLRELRDDPLPRLDGKSDCNGIQAIFSVRLT